MDAPDEGRNELEAVFLAEARRRLEEVDRILAAPSLQAGSPELGTLRRHAHSLKGTAGSLGYPRVERLAQSIQERLDPYVAVERPLPPPEEAAVREEFGAIAREVDGIGRRADGGAGGRAPAYP